MTSTILRTLGPEKLGHLSKVIKVVNGGAENQIQAWEQKFILLPTSSYPFPETRDPPWEEGHVNFSFLPTSNFSAENVHETFFSSKDENGNWENKSEHAEQKNSLRLNPTVEV